MDKQTVLHPDNGLSSSAKKRWATKPRRDVEGSRMHSTKSKKPVWKRLQTLLSQLYDVTEKVKPRRLKMSVSAQGRRTSRQRNYSVWWYNDRQTSLRTWHLSHRMHSTKSETEYKLWPLGDYDVSMLVVGCNLHAILARVRMWGTRSTLRGERHTAGLRPPRFRCKT